MFPRLFIALLLAAMLTATVAAMAQPAMNATTARLLSQAASIAKMPDAAQHIATKSGYPFVVDNGTPCIELFVKADPSWNPQSVEAIVTTRVGLVWGLRVPISAVVRLLRSSDVVALESASLCYPTTDVSVREIGADKVHLGEDGLRPLTGKGVIVGIFDSGIDPSSTDFQSDGTSRILSYWDMSDPTNDKSPSGFNWGREYNRTELTAGIPQNASDRSGHGTHVAGIAVGGGVASVGTRGVAPEAELVVVKGFRADRPRAGFSNIDIVAGCQYIMNVAQREGKPCVINLSLGTVIGPHDGTTLFEQQLDALVAPGRLIIAAAGNDGALPIHAGTDKAAAETIETMIAPINLCELFDGFCPPIEAFFMTAADVWFTPRSVDSVLITAYGTGSMALTPAKTLAYSLTGSAQNQPVVVDDEGTLAGFINLAISTSGHPNGDGNISVQIHNSGAADLDISTRLWSLSFVGSGSGRIDLWAGVPVPESFPVQGALGRTMYGNSEMTTGAPSTARQLISVGSYVTTNAWESMDGPQQTPSVLGSASSFSSRGPTRDGRQAPTVGAPGEMIGSTRSTTLATYSPMNALSARLPSRNVVMAQGTSMAAPHVTGTVALLLQYRPQLSIGSVRGILDRSSRHDAFAVSDDNIFGFGKLSAAAAVRDVLTSVLDEAPVAETRAWPIPASTTVTITRSVPDAPYWAVSVLGDRLPVRVLDESTEYVALDVSALSSGVWTIVSDRSPRHHRIPIVITR